MSAPVLHDPASATLAALAARIGAGDRDAEFELVRLYTPAVRESVRRHCRPCEPQVEDLVQDVLGALLLRLRGGAIDDLGALAHYLRIMIRNACTAYYRQHGRRLAMLRDAAGEPAECDPAGTAYRQQLRDLIRELLSAMPIQRDRELLRRYYIEGQACDRVCADLGIARHRFNRVAFRARMRLQEAAARRGIGVDD